MMHSNIAKEDNNNNKKEEKKEEKKYKMSGRHSDMVKGRVQGYGWFLTRFPLKLAENADVGETVIWGLFSQNCVIEGNPISRRVAEKLIDIFKNSFRHWKEHKEYY